jgi:predicted ribosomally synthesized peptide with SipW-like signal peptide
MSDDNLELSRRKILGSVGAVGAAGAAAGLGTSALFSDEELFTALTELSETA